MPPHNSSLATHLANALSEGGWRAKARPEQLPPPGDTKGLSSVLADEVVFYSPVAHTPQVGKMITLQYLSAALHVFVNEFFRYVRELTGPRDAVLEFQVEIDGINVNGVDMIKSTKARLSSSRY